jgi:DNA-binding response OmpR family regulator
MLPEVSGWDVCRTLRAESSVPIIMLTARDEATDKVVGLELGADDYVTKPFSPRELVSRVRAHLRRSDAPVCVPSGHTVGELRVDPDSHQVYMAGEVMHLTNTEFQILELLSRSPGKVFSRAAILDSLWNGGFVGDERAVDVHVHNIREKIEADPSSPQHLVTVRGEGYRLKAQ